jgi:hypothetical protein
MSRICQRLLRLGVPGAIGLFLLCDPAAAQAPDPRLEKVLADWQKRQDRFRAIKYEVRGTHHVPRGAYTLVASILPGTRPGTQPKGETPSQDLKAPVGFTLLLDFERERFWRELREQIYDQTDDRLVPQVMKDVFNGSVMKCYMPRKDNPGLTEAQPEMIVASGNMKNGAFRINYFPIFFGHGRIYTPMAEIIPGQLKKRADPEYLYVHGTGVHDGRTCLIVRTRTLKLVNTSFDEYWVDAARESAILRYVAYSGNNVPNDVTIRYSKSPGGWLPESWRWVSYLKGKTLYWEDMRVEKVTIDPTFTDANFDITITPGMVVEERTDQATNHPIATPKSTISVYKAEKDGGKEEFPDPYHRKGDQYQARRIARWAWAWLALPLAGIAGFLLWAKRRRGHRRVN